MAIPRLSYLEALAAVERLTAERTEAMRETWQWVKKATAYEEIVQAVADGGVYHDSKGGMLIVANADALLTKARALLERS